jgi:glyceraldehyde-3-phosphate dehydrogenase (NADP+)
MEAGKPVRTARIEVDRAVFVFKIAAEESKRIYGEIVPLDWLPGTEGRWATQHVPLGPVLGITPQLPLQPGRAQSGSGAGRRRSDPACRLTDPGRPLLAEVLLALAGQLRIAVTPARPSTQTFSSLMMDQLLTFTGSPAVGWSLKARAGPGADA